MFETGPSVKWSDVGKALNCGGKEHCCGGSDGFILVGEEGGEGSHETLFNQDDKEDVVFISGGSVGFDVEKVLQCRFDSSELVER